MGKKLEFRKIIPGESTIWRLEIQYKSLDQIHPSWLDLNSNEKTPIIFSKESQNRQEILDCERRMSLVYPPNEWNYAIGSITTIVVKI
jgi:hypothetical protein